MRYYGEEDAVDRLGDLLDQGLERDHGRLGNLRCQPASYADAAAEANRMQFHGQRV